MLTTYQNQQSPIDGTPFFQALLRNKPTFTVDKNTSTIRNLGFQDLIKLRQLEEYSHSNDCLEFSVKNSYVLEKGGKIVAAIMAQKIQGTLQISSLFMEDTFEGTLEVQELMKYIRLDCTLNGVKNIVFCANNSKKSQAVQAFLSPLR